MDMKRYILPLLALGIIVCSGSTARADQGMWLLPYLEKMNIDQMRSKGLRLDAGQIYNTDQLALKDAIVIFGGGCTGEIISPEGLILTNHHCGYGSIQQHSTTEHNYLMDGFWAFDRKDEIATPGLAVTFVREIRDVTSEILAKVKPGMSEEKRAEAIRKASDKLVKRYSDAKAFRTAQVNPMFGGNEYFLFVTEKFNDVRLVGAPPTAIGKFGGNTDNWMWPRHTGDFALFRVYASPDNKPANFHEDNVPYKAPKHLEISLKGSREGDFAMIMGFPGSTSRYMTTFELDQLTGQDNPNRIFIRGERQQIMWEDMMADPKVRIQYASKFASSSNYWKNSIGMNRGIERLNVKGMRGHEQAAFNQWVSEDPERIITYGQALPLIEQAVAQRRVAARVQQYMSEVFLRSVEGVTLGNTVYNILENEKKDKKAIEKIRKAGTTFFKDYHAPTDRKITRRMLEIWRDSVAASDDPDFFAAARPDIAAYAELLSESSIFTDSTRFKEALEGFSRTKIKSDPAYLAAASIAAKNKQLNEEVIKPAREKFNRGHRLWIAGQREMFPDKAFAPDANFTIRLTYGQVLPYWPADAVRYNFFTTLDGVMAKEDPNHPEFIVPGRLKELYQAKDFGPYAARDGRMRVNMLTNNDITGGNSGSGVLDGDGRLIGLAFDGNWEAMSGDIAFEPDLQRTISVDIRYVLFIIDKFAGATHLIDEMTIVR